MNSIEKPASLEAGVLPPYPGTQDLVLIDGKYAQCVSADKYRVVFYLLDDSAELFIEPEEWAKYDYKKPEGDVIDAGGLMKKGLMSKEQLEKVNWGSEEKKHPELKELVTFFGAYAKKE
jgi:hypothetical protein